MQAVIRGILPVLQTPLDAEGELDVASLRREVAFCIAAGAHGLVFPVLASEFQFLSDHERHRLVEAVISEAAHQVPVIVGVAAPSAAMAVEHARHAALAGADAVVALPPYVAPGSQAEVFAYYQAIAQASGLPVVVQHAPAGPGMDAALIRRLLTEVDGICYVKEEMTPSAHHVSALAAATEGKCLGIFGGALGRWQLSELRRGASGFLPAAESVDVHVQIWDAYQAGDEAAARHIFNQLLPLINLNGLLGVALNKEILVRRGVFRAAGMRAPGAVMLDDEDRRELDAILADLSPLFLI